MSAERTAGLIADLMSDHLEADVTDEPCEDMRSSGYFFEVEIDGVAYEVLVTEIGVDR